MQTSPFPQKWPYLHERCKMCWNEWKIHFPIFIFWVMIDCIYNLQVTHLTFQVCHRTINKFISKVAKFIWKMRNVLKWMKNQISNFCYFYFSSYGRFCSQFSSDYPNKNDQKILLSFKSSQCVCWIKWKTNFPIFVIFSFLRYSKFCTETRNFLTIFFMHPRPRMLLDWIPNLTG